MKLSSKSIILFDLDGTVIDSQEGIFNALHYTFKKLNIKQENADEFIKFIGPSIGSTFQTLYGMSAEQASFATKIYREYYSTKGLLECSLYDDMEKLLDMLKKQGKKLAIATKKPELFAKQIITNLKLDKYFTAVCGTDLNEASETKTHIIKSAMQKLGATNNADVLMVGDTKYDAIGAVEAGVDCVGVLHGFGSSDELFEHGCIAVAKDSAELIKMLCHD